MSQYTKVPTPIAVVVNKAGKVLGAIWVAPGKP